ncbi:MULTISPECIES: hypothetical protein [unclassified Streptomyces]|uniref:hypothetical protein n=1 Tax=unclassified Streptomyces TaxID=2593676 RepID=UPI0014898505|nr:MULTISPECIES: hypothetical protein [unclassified Streptomyces]
MASNVRFRMNSRGAKALLKSDGVRRHLQTRAGAIKAVAAPAFENATSDIWTRSPIRVVADTAEGSGRVFATVIVIHPAALRIERDQRILGGATDAARF